MSWSLQRGINSANNRMQPDFGNRYAIASAADAKRYVVLLFKQPNSTMPYIFERNTP